MNAKVICFASAKGGSGKTVVTASVGAFLVSLGKKVLLIDTDAATNGLTLLYLKEVTQQIEKRSSNEAELAGLYEEPMSMSSENLTRLPTGADLLPATYHFVNTEEQSAQKYELALRLALRAFRESYDYILLDAQAGSDLFARYAMSRVCSDIVVIVAEYDPLSAAGVERLKGLMPEDLTYQRTWILLNKVLPEFAKTFADFLDVAKYLSPIPWDAEVVRAYSRRRLALDLESGNTYTLAIMQAVRSLLGDELATETQIWTQSRAEAIRSPLNLQYADLERELASIMQATRRYNRANTLSTLVLALGISGILVAFFLVKSPGVAWSSFLELSLLSRTAIVSTVVGLVSSMFAVFGNLKRGASLEAELEGAKMLRRRTVVERQLQELEVLRTADSETLLRTKRS
jgi:cellulose biosynthesis protein BcsQ